jgi:hypothetical protein
MDKRVLNELFRFCLALVLVGSLFVIPFMASQHTVHAAISVPLQPDPLLGRWVLIADNGGGCIGSIADFRSDGTVIFTKDGKQTTALYRREPGSAWVERRAAEFRSAGLDGLGLEKAMKAFSGPGIELIEFADRDGKFIDHGSTLLKLDPRRRLLYNPVSQIWSRPGEEGAVKSQID